MGSDRRLCSSLHSSGSRFFVEHPPIHNFMLQNPPTNFTEQLWGRAATILWVDEFLHHPSNPGFGCFPHKYQQTNGFNHGFISWCEKDFATIHSNTGFLWEGFVPLSANQKRLPTCLPAGKVHWASELIRPSTGHLSSTGFQSPTPRVFALLRPKPSSCFVLTKLAWTTGRFGTPLLGPAGPAALFAAPKTFVFAMSALVGPSHPVPELLSLVFNPLKL